MTARAAKAQFSMRSISEIIHHATGRSTPAAKSSPRASTSGVSGMVTLAAVFHANQKTTRTRTVITLRAPAGQPLTPLTSTLIAARAAPVTASLRAQGRLFPKPINAWNTAKPPTGTAVSTNPCGNREIPSHNAKTPSAVPAKSRNRLARRGSSLLACATSAKAQADEATTTHTAQEKWKCQTPPMNQSPVAATRGLSGCHASHSGSREVKTVGDCAMGRAILDANRRGASAGMHPARARHARGILELAMQPFVAGATKVGWSEPHLTVPAEFGCHSRTRTT